MRLKNNPKAKDIVLNSPFCVCSPEKYKSTWKSSFSNNNPIFLEIGCGKGQFLSVLSESNKSNFYIGIEQYETVLLPAIKKAETNNSDNLLFICEHAEKLSDFFAPNEIDGIYLNFSDPWPKARHAKRRLTSERFLSLYRNILTNGAFIEMKTDNIDLFKFSFENLSTHSNFRIVDYTTDLYNNNEMLLNNVATEYENKFHSLGNPICKLVAIMER